MSDHDDDPSTLGAASPPGAAPPRVIDHPGIYHQPRAGAPIRLIVLHSTAGTNSLGWLTSSPSNTGRVSAHALVTKRGEIYRIVPDDLAANHCGYSRVTLGGKTYTGTSRPNINQVSLGVELENKNNGKDPYPDAQIAALGWLLADWQRIHGDVPLFFHRDIDTRGKSDPAGLSWATVRTAMGPPPADLTGHAILDGPSLPASDLVVFLDRRAQHLTWQQRSSIVTAYSAFGELTSIGNLRPFAQAWKETGGFTSRRFLSNLNPAGLGATNDGAEGAVFATIAAGVAAQYAHLLCYAAKPGELSATLATLQLLSPRRERLAQTFGLGSAPTWEALNGRWAFPGPTYGQDILTIAEHIAGGRP
jgi:hypothetical protein